MAIDDVMFSMRTLDGEMGHRDARRRLISAYNGELKADVIKAITAPSAVEFSSEGDDSARLWFILEGSARIEVQGKPGTYSLRALDESWDRLILPAHVGYRVSMDSGSILVGAVEREADEVNLYTQVTSGQPKCRDIFQKEVAGFAAAQLKFLLPFDADVVLGGHYHDYREAYSMLRGEVIFRFEDIEQSTQRQEHRIQAVDGAYLIVPSRKAHAAKASARSILVGCTEEAFTRLGDSAKPYSNPWLKFEE